ncbi:ABC transporter ATP-binding protein (plasmid) [Parasedimentitalea marina]|uniref:ABC transporter ATP-binding protein n=1 Tax=Parasedimentitalea marina TaxID=2483033 RepID=A0A3T0N9K0_9RHOB|nr:ABC transporter ATP-binding protein [Parasedimentitalea marina]AZV80697.1 ABC transporter ATP-binding protein [Parasedimentitalea marina]
MIYLDRLRKTVPLRGSEKVIIDDITATFPTGASVALLGRNGAGKSTLLKIIAGTLRPTSGQVLTDGSISYPVGFAGSFHGDLTGVQNTRFVARLYGVDTDELVDFVQDFAELGRHFHMPLRTYSSGMKARLSFGVSMGIRFDTYLIDEVTSVGDGAFKRKSVELFEARLENASAVVVTHSPPMVRRMCNYGVVLEEGKVVAYSDIEEALEHHDRNLKEASSQ